MCYIVKSGKEEQWRVVEVKDRKHLSGESEML